MRQDALSLSERLYRWLKLHPQEWINGGSLEKLAMDAGYKASNASRRLRELAEWSESGQPPQIERDERSGANGGPRTVWYRWVEDREAYKPKTDWDRQAIAWYAKNCPEMLPKFIDMLIAYDEIPDKPKVIPNWR